MTDRPFATEPAVAAEITDEMIDKVNDLLDHNCVTLVAGFEDRAAVVNGSTSWYTVRTYHDGLSCDCPAGNQPTCSHRLAAMVVWESRRAR